jgi:hypothetical protein
MLVTLHEDVAIIIKSSGMVQYNVPSQLFQVDINLIYRPADPIAPVLSGNYPRPSAPFDKMQIDVKMIKHGRQEVL